MYNRFCYNCNAYIEDKHLKRYCRLCLNINKDFKGLITPSKLIIEDPRIINRIVGINLCKLHNYFKQRYNIIEDIQDIFNLWLELHNKHTPNR